MEIEINSVSIPVFNGKVGLSMSGGADSSLLLYILLSNKSVFFKNGTNEN